MVPTPSNIFRCSRQRHRSSGQIWLAFEQASLRFFHTVAKFPQICEFGRPWPKIRQIRAASGMKFGPTPPTFAQLPPKSPVASCGAGQGARAHVRLGLLARSGGRFGTDCADWVGAAARRTAREEYIFRRTHAHTHTRHLARRHARTRNAPVVEVCWLERRTTPSGHSAGMSVPCRSRTPSAFRVRVWCTRTQWSGTFGGGRASPPGPWPLAGLAARRGRGGRRRPPAGVQHGCSHSRRHVTLLSATFTSVRGERGGRLCGRSAFCDCGPIAT